MKTQVDQSQYFKASYDPKKRFSSYWHQVNEIISVEPKQVLEIGIGNGFVSNYLRKRRISVFNIDIDPLLNPSVIATATSLPFPNDSFDAVACFEVLEHLPFEFFEVALAEIRRVTKNLAVISVPDIGPNIRLYFHFPLLKEIRLMIKLPMLYYPEHVFAGEHFWEINKKDFPLKKIMSSIKNSGFLINRSYQVFEQPYHRFFVLMRL